jgi:hypothetical protein
MSKARFYGIETRMRPGFVSRRRQSNAEAADSPADHASEVVPARELIPPYCSGPVLRKPRFRVLSILPSKKPR